MNIRVLKIMILFCIVGKCYSQSIYDYYSVKCYDGQIELLPSNLEEFYNASEVSITYGNKSFFYNLKSQNIENLRIHRTIIDTLLIDNECIPNLRKLLITESKINVLILKGTSTNNSLLNDIALIYDSIGNTFVETENFDSLERLFVESNVYFSSNDLFQNKNIKSITLYESNIDNIPEEIGKLENLEYLDVSRNNIKKIPEYIFELKNLKEFNLHLNPINKRKVKSIRKKMSWCKVVYDFAGNG